jgi:hypothetical protein
MDRRTKEDAKPRIGTVVCVCHDGCWTVITPFLTRLSATLALSYEIHHDAYIHYCFSDACLGGQKKQYIADYDQAFTESDLEKLLDFMRSEDGRRILQAQQKLDAKVTQLYSQFMHTADSQIMSFLRDTKNEMEGEARAEADKELKH